MNFLTNKITILSSFVVFISMFFNYLLSFNWLGYLWSVPGVLIEFLFFLIPLYWSFLLIMFFKKNGIILLLTCVFVFLYVLSLIKMGAFHLWLEIILDSINM